jgi:NAD+ synthase
MQELIEQISIWIKEEVRKAGKSGVVLGLSGGLDSTITAFLCKKALGEKNVLGMIMPCHSNKKVLEDAKLSVEFLKIPNQCLDLTPAYDMFLSILPEGDRTSLSNLKARLRMVALYYFANKLNYLVAGTGNKSECSVGYFTKYGDGAVDFMPVADIYKTELVKLAEYINAPRKIIDKPPSADLWEGQTDEKEMGITYKELDNALKNLLENKKHASTAQEKLVERMIKNATHKTASPPIFKRKNN